MQLDKDLVLANSGERNIPKGQAVKVPLGV